MCHCAPCVTLSLCAGVDRVVLVEDGKIVEQGSYMELQSLCH